MPSSIIVPDASFIISYLFDEVLAGSARRLMEDWQTSETRLVAPTLLKYEFVAGLRKRAHKGLLSADNALATFQAFQRLPIEFTVEDPLTWRSFELASQLNLPTAYDSQYLAVAEKYDAIFWTADERLFNSVSNRLNYIRLLT